MAANCRIGYFEETGYAAEGNVIRHGDVLHDMAVDFDKKTRVLGMIGMLDVEVMQSDLFSGEAPLAYMILVMNGIIQMIPVCYTDPMVKIYGLDPNTTGLRQVIRLEMLGFTAMAVITMIGDMN